VTFSDKGRFPFKRGFVSDMLYLTKNVENKLVMTMVKVSAANSIERITS
jgi:hypothetical protein